MNAWREVSKAFRCPRCSKDHWCAYNHEAGLLLCMRVSGGKEKVFKTGEIGWLYKLDGTVAAPPAKLQTPPPVINSGKLLAKWREQMKPVQIEILSRNLGVAASSLLDLGATWSPYRAWAFGMKDGFGNLIGIRLRSSEGKKWSVKGSHQGLFFGNTLRQSLALVVEGPTSCAAGLTMGYYTVGLPSAGSGIPALCQFVRRFGVKRVVLIADNKIGDKEDPGLAGMQNVARFLPVPSCLLVLPAKDLRAYLQMGGTAELLDSMINSSVWS